VEFVRQAAARFRAPRTLLVMAAVAVAIGLAGPFGTYATLALAPRLAYWLLVVTVSVLAAFIIEPLVENRAADWPPILREAAVIGAFTLAFTPFMFLLNLFFRWPVLAPGGMVYLAACVALVGTVIRFLRLMFERQAPAAPPEPPAPPAPPLLRRIGLNGQASIVSISVDDHYVEIRDTTGAAHRLLMRFSDAVAEAEGLDGMLLHRSHWVARDQIAARLRRGSRELVVLRDGSELPVSRTYRDALAAARPDLDPAAEPSDNAGR
jgi:hypothetical protein